MFIKQLLYNINYLVENVYQKLNNHRTALLHQVINTIKSIEVKTAENYTKQNMYIMFTSIQTISKQ